MPGTRWRDEEIVENLTSMDPDARLRALRALKNQIIGNKTKKLSYVKLGAVPRIVEILVTDSSVPLLIQSAAAVGSFACGTEEGVKAVLQSDVLPHMLQILSHQDDQVVQAVARSLKLIFNSALAPRANMFEQNALKQLLQLLFSKNITVAEVAASVLARCCETPGQQSAIASAGAIPRLVHLLSLSTPKSQEAALDALASLTHSNAEISLALLAGPVVERICVLLKDRNTRLRVLACSCLANMSRASTPPTGRQHELAALALPVAVRLVGEGEAAFHEAPQVVAQLVSGNADMQKVACDAEVVPRLANLLKKEHDLSPRLLETTLLALAALTERLEQSRRQLVEAKVLDKIVQALADSEQGVRISACKCCLSMSRSVKNLRTALVDSNITQALLNLLTDVSTEVKEAAAATLCNMVLDFSPMKEQLLKSGGLRHLAALAQAPEYVLRLNSMWALKNLLYLSKTPSKEAVMQSLSYNTMRQLLLDPVEEVQEQALTVVRNLVYGSKEDIEQVLKYSNGDVLLVLEEKLRPLLWPAPPPRTPLSTPIKLQALYTTSNIATGTPLHKDALMRTSIPAAILTCLRDAQNCVELKVAALWCLINLSWQDTKGGESGFDMEAAARVRKLRGQGFEELLHSMKDDASLDIKNRVHTALEQFDKSVATADLPQLSPMQEVLPEPPDAQVPAPPLVG